MGFCFDPGSQKVEPTEEAAGEQVRREKGSGGGALWQLSSNLTWNQEVTINPSSVVYHNMTDGQMFHPITGGARC